MNALKRLLRQSEAPYYLSLSVPEFNKRVRPFVPVIQPPDMRAVFYDVRDLDAWADQFKAQHAKPPAGQPCPNPHPALENAAKSGTSKKPSQAQPSDFAKALANRTLQRQKTT